MRQELQGDDRRQGDVQHGEGQETEVLGTQLAPYGTLRRAEPSLTGRPR